MGFYLVSYDVTQKENQRSTAIYAKIDAAIQDLDNDAESILASQWLIESDDSEEAIGRYILRQSGSDRGRIQLLVNPIERGFAYPDSLNQRLLRKLR